jgi:transcriptional regulator with XRE-family HTH domain
VRPSTSQCQSLVRISSNRLGQGRVALLQPVPLRLKASRPKEADFDPRSLGEHIRKRRLILKLNKRQVAARLGVTGAPISHWERGETHTPIERIPVILGFLGYDPFPEPETVSERLLAKRRTMGWSIRQAARELGVDPATWTDWEHGKIVLFRAHRVMIASWPARARGKPRESFGLGSIARMTEAISAVMLSERQLPTKLDTSKRFATVPDGSQDLATSGLLRGQNLALLRSFLDNLWLSSVSGILYWLR